MERNGDKSYLEQVDIVMNSRYPLVRNNLELTNLLSSDVDQGFSFESNNPRILKFGVEMILSRAFDSQRKHVLNPTHNSGTAVDLLAVELKANPKNVAVGYLQPLDDQEEAKEYVIQTKEPLKRSVDMPNPYLWTVQTEISGLDRRSEDVYHKAVLKKLRSATRDFGIGFGVLSGIYLGMTTQEVLKFFQDENFKADLQRMGLKSPSMARRGDRGTDDPSKMGDYDAIDMIKRTMQENPIDGYDPSLNIARKKGWVPNDRRRVHYGKEQIVQEVVPHVHPLTADKVAISESESMFNPYELGLVRRHIAMKYSSILTSEIDRAHLVPVRPIPRW